MTQMGRHLLRQLPYILLTIALLVTAARLDLAVPGYIADIVNIGLQQSGVPDNVPEQIPSDEMAQLHALLTPDQADFVAAQYRLHNGVLYLRSDISADVRQTLSELLLAPQAAIFAPERLGLPDDMRLQIGIQYVLAQYAAMGIDLSALQSAYIRRASGMMLGITLLSAMITVLTVLLAARIAAAFSRDTRQALFSKVLRFSGRELGQFSTASLITRATNDVQQVQVGIVLALRLLVFAPVLGVGALFQVMGTERSMTWIIGLAIGLLSLFVVTLMIIVLPKFSKVQQLLDQLNLVTREILTGLPVIRAFSQERHEEKRFESTSLNLVQTNLFVGRALAMLMPAITMIMNGTMLLIIRVGADRIAQGSVQIGHLLAFIQYAMQVMLAFLMLTTLSFLLPRSIISFGRIAEVLDTALTLQDPALPARFPENSAGVLRFEHVSFRYPGANGMALSDLSFTANPGETTAIIGATGSGKSTLAALIPRFYDVTEGRITLDGVDIRTVTLHDLREKIGLVPQKANLFAGTIQENIAYGGKTVDEIELRRALDIAQASAFVMEMPGGVHSRLAQGGSNVSGGQRQRLSIARAILKKPKLYLFDDSFSALDPATDAALRKALHAETANATVLIVAQRISTILRAEKILVLDEGRIVGEGNHAQLMEQCAIYRQIAESQLAKQEADA